MNGIKRIFFSSIIAVTLVAGASFSISKKNENYQSRNSIDTVKEGVNICFSRLQQTYTSVYISPNLTYLALDFLKATESCFAQVLSVAINAQLEKSAKSEKLINRLGNYVRLFHAGVKNKSLFANGSGDYSVANSRFVKLEETRDEILEGLDTLSSGVAKKESALNSILYALLSGVVFGLLAIAYFDRRSREKFNLYKKQISIALNSNNKTEDIGQAFIKALKFFDIQIPASANIDELSKTINEERKQQAKETQQVVARAAKKIDNKDKKPLAQAIPMKKTEDAPAIKVSLGDILGEILLEYSPDILSNKISTKFNEFEEIEFHGNTTRLYHLIKFIFGILVKSEFNGAPYINLEVQKENGPVIHFETNSVLSQLESPTSRNLFAQATDSFSEEFDLLIIDGENGTKSISIKQKKRLVKIFKGTKKQFLERQATSV